MVKKVILVIGIFGVGKSFQCDNWMKNHPEYKLMNTREDVEGMFEEMKGHDYWIGDYYFHKDIMAKKLKEALGCEIEFWILFDNPDEIVQRQLTHKPETNLSPKDCWLVQKCYLNELKEMHDCSKFFDGQMKEYTKEEFLKKFNAYYDEPSKEEVKAFLDRIDKMPGYDKYYHHFNLPHGFRIGKDNYARNEMTWDIIKDWFDWKNLKVLDLCGFHFYFCQQIQKAGGIPTGMDRSTAAIHTGGVFAKWNKTPFHLYHYDIDKHQGDDGLTAFPKKEFDLVMLFNVLHHLTNKDRLLQKIAKYPKLLFEGNKQDKELIEKYFNIIKQQDSPKDNRYLLLCEPK